MADLAVIKGIIPKYDSAGNLSETGRTYRVTIDDEVMEAKKKDDIVTALRDCPKVQEYLIQKLKGSLDDLEEVKYSEDDEDNELFEFDDEDSEDNGEAEEVTWE